MEIPFCFGMSFTRRGCKESRKRVILIRLSKKILIPAFGFVLFALVLFFQRGAFHTHSFTQSKVLETKIAQLGIVTELEGRNILWTREVKQFPSHLEVRETLFNQGAAIEGIRFTHSLKVNFKQVWLGGQSYETLFQNLSVNKSPINFSDPWNPTVYAKNETGSVAIVAEDDVFRQQVRLFMDPLKSQAGMRTESFCLDSQAQREFIWSIYTNTVADTYWDFINRLRTDWNVNRDIKGAFLWFHPQDILNIPIPFLRSELKRQNVQIANMFGGWVDHHAAATPGKPPFIGFGSATLLNNFSTFRDSIAIAIKKLKFAQPSLKVLLYFDAQRDSTPEAPFTYPDSVVTSENNRVEFTDWMGKYSRTWSLFPTLQNGFGIKLLEVTKAVLSLGADGVYWDEMESLDYSEVRTTFNRWDGVSCKLDRNLQIVSKMAYLNLLSEEAKLAYANAAGAVMANSPPTTRRFQSRPDLHMVEAQHHSDYSAYAHLTTPLAYIGSDDNWPQIIAPIHHGLLPVSVRLGYQTEFFKWLYPIYPINIFADLIEGRDKIVATRSGTYGWSSQCLSVRPIFFKADGKQNFDPSAQVTLDGLCRIHAILKKGEAIILVRTPSDPSPTSKNPAFYDPIFL